jgi:hypothetical protein
LSRRTGWPVCRPGSGSAVVPGCRRLQGEEGAAVGPRLEAAVARGHGALGDHRAYRDWVAGYRAVQGEEVAPRPPEARCDASVRALLAFTYLFV